MILFARCKVGAETAKIALLLYQNVKTKDRSLFSNKFRAEYRHLAFFFYRDNYTILFHQNCKRSYLFFYDFYRSSRIIR